MWVPGWLNWYKKPEYRDIKEYSNAVVSGKRPVSPDGRSGKSIPVRLRLDRVLDNKTCAFSCVLHSLPFSLLSNSLPGSPMSLYDFYMYLKYIEFSPENLEFYVWFKNYEQAYRQAMAAEKDNASLSSATESTSSLTKGPASPSEAFSTDPEVGMFSFFLFLLHELAPFCARPNDPAETLARITEMISIQAMCVGDSCKPTFDLPKPPIKSADAPGNKLNRVESTLNLVDASAGRRAELSAVIKTFLKPGAEKELNIPSSMRDAALAELQNSTDPAHLRPIADHVYLLLRNCSHRNFVRLGVSNGTFETLCVATTLGIVLTIAGVLCVLLRAFTPHIGAHSRFDVFAAWPMWWLGLSLILSGMRGSCFFLLLFTRRQPLPWERFDDSASIISQRSGIVRAISRLMIFDRKLRVKDAHLRRLQHRIVLQSLVFGAFFSCVGVCIFIFLPIWKETRH